MNAAENKGKITNERKFIVSVKLNCGQGQSAAQEYNFLSKRKAQNFIRRLRSAWEQVYPDAVILLYELTQATETDENGEILWQNTTRQVLPPVAGAGAYNT